MIHSRKGFTGLSTEFILISSYNRSVKRNTTPQTDASATRVWLVLWRAARAIEQNAVNSLSSLGLGLSDFAVLELLLHKGPRPVNAIGKRVLLKSGSITAAINRLESKGLVRRTAHPEDQRARVVELTDAGKRLIEAVFQQHSADMEETMSVLRPRERVELVRMLKKVGLWAQARLEDLEDRKKQK
jgi:MarR family 2-MHQ and catechol resistance regulon transcriptional repressor